MPAPPPTPESFDQPGRPRRPPVSRDPAPLAPERAPRPARLGFGLWGAGLLAAFAGLLAAVLWQGEATQRLIDARPVDRAGQQAVAALLYGTLAAYGVLIVVEFLVLSGLRRHRRGRRPVLTVLALAQAWVTPVVLAVVSPAGVHGTGVDAALYASAGLVLAGSLPLWTPSVTRWLRA